MQNLLANILVEADKRKINVKFAKLENNKIYFQVIDIGNNSADVSICGEHNIFINGYVGSNTANFIAKAIDMFLLELKSGQEES